MKIGDKFHYLLHIRNFATIQPSSATRCKKILSNTKDKNHFINK